MFNSTFFRKAGKELSLLTFLFLIAVRSYGQIGVTVTGNTNTTPNLLASYPNFTAAVADLNLVTAMSGPVTLTLAAGTSETAPIKGFNISTATAGVLNATNTLTIVKAAGAATVINAGVGTAATAGVANPDGMMYLSGSDYVTIDGLTFTDGNSTNATVAMEFGIALFKRAAGDGCNNNTIQNCIFNMQRINNSTASGPMGEGANAIEIVNSTAAAAATALTPTNGGTLATNGTNSNNRIYGNTINGGNAGIHLGGYLAPSGQGPSPNPATFLGDIGNDIGGTVVGTGNTILNFGGGAAVQPAVGIRANLQWSVNIRFNTIDNNNGAGVNHATTLRGIYAQAGVSANATISNNTVTVRSGATTSALTAIDNGIGSTAAVNTVNINDNTIRFSYTSATSGIFTAVSNSSSAATLNINNNNIQQLGSTNYPSTGTIPVIVVGSPGVVNVNTNTISNFNMTSAAGGTLRAITASTPTGLYTVSGNTIENLRYSTVGSTGNITGIYNLASATQENWNNNIIRNFSTPGTGTLNGMQNNTVTGTFQVNNNQIYNFSTTAGGAGGFSANGIIWSNATSTISGNQIYSINSTGTTGGTGGTINGISVSNASTISNNRIYDLSSNSTNPTVAGIASTGGTLNTIQNNLIGDLRTPFANAAIPLIGINVTGSTATNVYYNTVYLNGSSSGALFGSAAINASSTPALTLRNNIFYNISTPSGAGLTVAYRRTTTTLTSYQAASNNNLFYAGTPGANNLIFTDLTNFDQTLGDFKTRVASRDANSESESIAFQSLVGANANFLKYPVGTAMKAENGAVNIGGITTDFFGTVRQGNVGYLGTGTAPDMGAWELEGIGGGCTLFPTATITPAGPLNYCSPNGTPVAMTGGGSGGNGGPYTTTWGPTTQLWTNAGGTIAYTALADVANVWATPASSTTYTLTVTDGAGCASTATKTININTGVTLPALTNSGPVCPGSTATLTSNASLPVSASAYIWSSGSGQPLYTITSPTTVTTVSTGTVDDGQNAITPAPTFTFPYTGTNYTAFSAGTNGYVTIGGISTAIPSSLTSLAGLNVVFAFGRDGNLNNVNSGDLTHGPAAGGLYVFQYNLTSGASGGGTSAVITATYQIVLWGAGSAAPGRIQIIYGSSIGTPGTAGTIGIKDIANTYVNGINGLNNSLVTSAAWPASGTLYTFEPPVTTLTYAWVAAGPPADNSDFDDQTIAVPTVGPLGSVGNYPYQLTVTNTGNGCTAVRTTTVVVQVTALSVNVPTVNNSNICAGSGTNVTLTGTNKIVGGCPPYDYEWIATPGGVIASGTLPQANSVNTFVVSPTVNTTYTLRIMDDGGSDETSPGVTINVTNPPVLTSSAATRCGVGTTQLTGTVNGGDVLAWYTASTGGTLIGTGSPVTSPVISGTTTFYAAAITGGAAATVGKAAPTEDGFVTTAWGIQISASSPGLIVDATVYPYGSGTITVALLNSGGTELFATSPIAVVGNGTGTIPVVLPLNFPVAIGTNYRLVVKAYTGITNLRRDFSGNSYPYTGGTFSIPASWNGSATTGAYYFFYNLNVLSGCEGTRVPVTATVNPPPALTVSADQVVCNNVTTPLSVTTGGASYNTYIWAPQTDLFTDAGATVPYTGTSATTVYAKTTTAGTTTYTLTGTQTGGAFCVNTDEVDFTNQPNPTGVNPSLANICVSGSVTMSLSPSTGYASGTIQWQTGATIPLLADIGGANASSYTTPVISSGTPFYRVIVKNGLGATCTQYTVPFTVNNPVVLTTTPATRCGQGTVNLLATVNGGSTISWFDSPTGGSQVGTGSPFATPTITNTTTYYAAAIGNPYTFNLGLPDNTVGTYSASTASDWPVRFTTTKATKVKTVVVYPTVAGNLFIALRASASTVDIANIGPFTLQASDIGNPVILTLDISIPTAGDYQLTGLSTGPGRIGRMSALVGTPYPFLSPDGSVSVYGSATTSGTALGSFSTTSYNSFFNIEFESACESGRTAVVATVTPAPALNPPAANPAAVCSGDPTILSISSGNAGYTYTWQPGALVGATQSVSPASTIVYTVNALDNSGGPNNGCFNTAQIQVNVNPVPSAATVNVTPAGLVCGGTIKTLAATSNTAATYSFGTQASTNTASTTAAGYPGPYSVYYGGQRMQMLIRASELSSSGFVTGSQLTSIAFTVVSKGSNNPSNISFQMNIGHTALSGLAANSFQGGLTNVVAPTTYASTIGLNTHTFSSPFVWNGVDNVIIETTFGNSITGTTNDLVSTYYSPTSFVSTIVYRGDGVTNGSPAFCATATNTSFIYSARPDFTLNGSLGATSITWTPIANLFTDNGATSAYVNNTNFPTVYSKMNATTSVNARVTLTATGCFSDAPVSLLYTPRPTVDISANEFVCSGQSAPVNFFFTGTGPWDMTYNIGGGPISQTGIGSSPIDIPYVNATTDRTYTVTALSDASGCTSLPEDLDALTLIVPIPCEISWNGSQGNQDWFDADNWTPNNSAPSQFTSVKIPGWIASQPNITGNAFAANINLFSSPLPSIAAGGVLNVKGNINGGLGSTISGLGKVIINGTGLQTISGRVIVPNLDLGNTSTQGLVIAPGAELKVNPTAATGTGLVTILNNSKTTVNGSFILGSTALATAKIGPVPATFTLTGDVTQERWLPYTSSTGGTWNFIASPFSGKNFTNWVDDFKVVGLNTGFGPQGSGIINSNEPERSTVFHYDEPTHDTRLDTVQKQGWRIPGNVNIAPGKGYRVWVDHYSNGSHKFNNQGAFVFGDFNFPSLNRTELAGCIPATFPCDEPALRGWNLVANPYPCDIDWDATGGAWTKPIQMSNAWYRWHAAANGYGVYTSGLYAGTTPEPANPNLIPSSQAFFVRLAIGGTYNATLAVKETAKVTASSGQYVRTNVSAEKIRITISKPNVVNGYSTVVRFMDGATDGFDFAFDFSSLGGSGFNIGVPVDNDLLSIASFAPIAEYKVIPLTIRYNGNFGSFNLKFSDMASLLENNVVFLRDNLENTLTPVTEGSQYAFGVSPLDGMLGSRFELVFNPQSITSTVAPVSNKLGMTVYPNPTFAGKATTISLVGFESSAVNLRIVDALGRNVFSTKVAVKSEGITEFTLAESLPAGMYTIQTSGGNQTLIQKLVVK